MTEGTSKKLIFWASFLTLIAAGMGFAVRTSVLGDWATDFGFTKLELGTITGGGLVGFGAIIILSSFFVDKVGYKPILLIAVALHILSAVITLAASAVFVASGKDATYYCLYIGTFMFAIANGLCEAVINPLTATLFPKQKTHYLNILHAGWPGGIILGALLAYCFMGDEAAVYRMAWEIPMALFLIPTALYGFIVLKESFPESEATAAGVSFRDMLKEFAAPILLFLFVLHAMVGYVELGTDSWITDIMKNVIGPYGILLLLYTSGIMFVLRFFAGPIVERINPIGLLLISSVLGCIGLYLLGSTQNAMLIFLAATVYGVGKTFLWPTMLGVVGERYPRGGAITMGFMGGIGMLSAGLVATPSIGYEQDYYATQNLKAASPEAYARYQADEPNKLFRFFSVVGLNGAKKAVLNDSAEVLTADLARLEERKETSKELSDLQAWWTSVEPFAEDDVKLVNTADIAGGQAALRWTSLVPFAMAIGYLLLFLYFSSTGGYQAISLGDDKPKDGEKMLGGVEAPVR